MELRAAVTAACHDVVGLQAALVFGSALRRPDPGDIDLALLWAEGVSTEDRWRVGNRIAGEIEQQLRATGLNVDLKDLRALPLPLQYRVLQEGQAVYVSDRRAFVRFSAETVPRALDFLPFYRQSLRMAARKLAGE